MNHSNHSRNRPASTYLLCIGRIDSFDVDGIYSIGWNVGRLVKLFCVYSTFQFVSGRSVYYVDHIRQKDNDYDTKKHSLDLNIYL